MRGKVYSKQAQWRSEGGGGRTSSTQPCTCAHDALRVNAQMSAYKAVVHVRNVVPSYDNSLIREEEEEEEEVW